MRKAIFRLVDFVKLGHKRDMTDRTSKMKKTGLSARIAALNLLQAIVFEKQSLSELTDPNGAIFKPLSGPDRARAQSLTILALKNLEPIDKIIDSYLKKKPPLRALNILRLCATELLVDDIQPHAAIDSAVEMAKTSRKTAHLSGLINAISRKINDQGKAQWPQRVTQKLPKYLRSELLKDYDDKTVATIEAVHEKIAPLDIVVKNNADLAKFAELLDAQIVGPQNLRIYRPHQISSLPGFDDGSWWVQDFAASLPVQCFGDLTGKKIIDLCAAPGGKTMQLAAAGADVTAVDISANRMKRLQENLSRTKLSANVIIADILNWVPDHDFDAILLDAPCSATGTIRRHPDLPFVKNADSTTELYQLQRQMLKRCFDWLKTDGEMIYATCSLLKKEGEHNIAWLKDEVSTVDVSPIDLVGFELPQECRTPQGYLRTLPSYWSDIGGMDGFFIAKLHKIIR